MQKQLSQSQMNSSFNVFEFCIPNRSDSDVNYSQNQVVQLNYVKTYSV